MLLKISYFGGNSIVHFVKSMEKLIDCICVMFIYEFLMCCWLPSLLQVNNTDAEGRLTLADALVYACNQGVEKVPP